MTNKGHACRQAGFTLFELLLVVAAFGILASISIPFSNSSIVRGNLESNARALETSLRRAYTYARAGENDTDWGVHITATDMTVFAGASYDDRTTDLDETNNIPSAITIGGTLVTDGVADILFTKGTGIPATEGTITLTSNQAEKILTISAIGAITVN